MSHPAQLCVLNFTDKSRGACSTAVHLCVLIMTGPVTLDVGHGGAFLRCLTTSKTM